MIPLRFTSLLLASSLLSVVALAGCSESDVSSEEARFADATPAQLERVYSAASARDLVAAMLLSAQFSGQNAPGACPAIVTVGQDTTVTGGCTTEDGVRVDGSIAMHNLFGLEEDFAYDPTHPSSIELDFRVTTSQGERIDLDGRIELEKFEQFRFQGDLTISAGGVASTSRLTLDCNSEPCTALPGSEIELSDLGGGSVEGAWLGGSDGSVTVRGADVLVIDVAADSDKNGCAPYTIGDQRGIVCPSDDLERLSSFVGFEGPMLAAPRSPRGSWLLRSAQR